MRFPLVWLLALGLLTSLSGMAQEQTEAYGVPAAGERQAWPAPGSFAASAPASFHDGTDKLLNDRSTDTYPRITQSETSMAAIGSTVLVGWNDSGHAASCSGIGYARSANSGDTWTDKGFLPPGGTAASAVADPVLGANHLGQFFFAALAQGTGGTCGATGRSFIGLWRSLDDGDNFAFLADASPGTPSGNVQDKEEMAIDTSPTSSFQGNIYLCWTEIEPGFSSVIMRIRVSRSTNDGLSFSLPFTLRQVTVTLGDQTVVGGCGLAVAPDGKVYAAWAEGVATPGVVGAVKLRRSDNGGDIWNSEVTVATGPVAGDTSTSCTIAVPGFGSFPRPALKGQIRDAPTPTLAVSPGGQVNLAVSQGLGASSPFLADIMYTRSSDLGVSWDPLITINSNSTNDQFQPRLAVDSFGTIAVLWYDRRHDPSNLRIHVREGISYDNGLSFTDLQVTDADFGIPPLNPNFDDTADCYMGDYNAIIAHGSRFLMAWGDNRLDTSGYSPGPDPDHPDPDVRFDAHSSTDLDGDGLDNSVDADDDGDGYTDADEIFKGSNPFTPESTPEHCDGVDNDGDTQVDEQPAGASWDIDGDTLKDCLDASVDTDGDGAVNTVDADDDGDGRTDAQERKLSTDELGSCSTSASHDAWGSDRDRDKDADIGDVIQNFNGKILNPANYDARSDADADGDNDVGDVIQLYGMGKILTKCAAFAFTNNTGGAVDDIHIEWSAGIEEVFVARDSELAAWSNRSIGGGGLILDMDRPDGSGDLANGGQLTVVVRTASSMAPSVCQWTLEGINQGAC